MVRPLNFWHNFLLRQIWKRLSLLFLAGLIWAGCAQQPVQPEQSVSAPAQIVKITQTDGYTCEEGVQSSGALYRICVPTEGWNGDLFLWAHGYVSPTEPLRLENDQELVQAVTGAGYAYATTSYRKNGLAVREGIADLLDLVNIFTGEYGEPRYTYLVGGSEGGIITTLSIEQHPDVYDGGLSLCGPIGDFQKQINYFGDFRLIFDYFFPGVLPGDPTHIPQELMDHFFDVYVPRILDAIHADPHATEQLLRVTHAAYDLTDPSTIDQTVVQVLWFNVFATNEAQEELGGQMFDNMGRYYKGSDDDAKLNREIPRYKADPQAAQEIALHYQTSGHLTNPLVSLHTVADPIVPFWHQPLYRWKVWNAGAIDHYSAFPIFRYGHCNFQPEEVLAAFELLVIKVTGQGIATVASAFPDVKSRERFYAFRRELQKQVGKVVQMEVN